MILYIIKTIACSAILFLVYKLLLEKARMNRFKRYFLLGAIIFSFIIPLIEFTIQPKPTSEEIIVVNYDNGGFYDGSTYYKQVNHYLLDYDNWLLMIYCIIAGCLLIRCFKNIVQLLRRASSANDSYYKNIKIVFADDAVVPYSFGNRIFVSEKSFCNNEIDDRILCHEAAHITQKHSWDIVFVEIVKAIAWFNPLLYAYKKAIQLNHEFLADEVVLKQYPETTGYMELLVQQTIRSHKFSFSSSFNFLITKKRFSMLTQKTSMISVLIKITIVMLVIGICIYVFPEKTVAQQKQEDNRIGVMVVPPVQMAGQGASKELMEEVEHLMQLYRLQETDHKKITSLRAPDSIQKRLHDIYALMNEEQRKSVSFSFIKFSSPFAKSIPTNKQLNGWKNENVYGVWIDGKQVKNEALNNYNNTDFSHAYTSKLYGKAKENKRYQYQVDLMTNDYYKSYYNKAIADTAKYVFIVKTLKTIEKKK